MNDYEINDKRDQSEFKGKTFSKYEKSKVKKQLLSSLYNNNIEPACYWSIELICAGHYSDLWDIILLYIGRYIHIANPKLPIYIEMRFQSFKDIILGGYVGNELILRNNMKIRKLFAEIISILVFSKKKYALENLSIKDKNEFDITYLTNRLKAPNINYINNIFKENDPKEIFIAINEFNYHISNDSKDCTNATYWVEWILQYENLSKQRKIICKCETRAFVNVHEKFMNDFIWMIWESLITRSKEKNNIIYNKIILSLLNLFTIKYTNSCKRKRKYLIYFAICLLTENIDFNIPVISNKQILDNIISNINVVYKEAKKNEIKPDTDYLFNGIETNINKTIDKLDIMDKLLNSN